MWGIIPAAGQGTRIQPLAFSKELLPVGARHDEAGRARPRAVSEYLLDRMVCGGVRKLCFVIAPGKSDILHYYGGSYGGVPLCYTLQDTPAGLCDAIFSALPVIPPDEPVVIGLPDTVWFPEDALAGLRDDRFSFLLFPVDRPDLFDAVETDADGRVLVVHVKQRGAPTRWVWGAFKLPGAALHLLHDFWLRRGRCDEFVGTLVNAWIAEGHAVWGVRAGTDYIDVGTLDGWRDAQRRLGDAAAASVPLQPAARPGGPRFRLA